MTDFSLIISLEPDPAIVSIITASPAMAVVSGLQGSPGSKGDQGNVGAKGDRGDAGPKGEDGFIGHDGTKGDTGAAGTDGAKGDKGDTGAAGTDGAKGDKGDKGDTGAAGAKGDTGAAGTDGAKGDKGDKGDTGAAGTDGAKGDKGDTGTAGVDGDTGPAGPTAVSSDVGNLAVLGTDSKLLVNAAHITPAAIGAATVAQGTDARPPDINGMTAENDILADDDYVPFYDASETANRKGILTKFWDYITAKITVIGIAPYITGYSQAGNTTLTASSGTLTIPLDGKCYSYTIPSGTAITLALSDTPTPPLCASVQIEFTQHASSAGTLAYPSAWLWVGSTAVPLPTALSAKMLLEVQSMPSGSILAFASWVGVQV